MEDLENFMKSERVQKRRMAAWARDKVKRGPCRECGRAFSCGARWEDRDVCWAPWGTLAVIDEWEEE